MAPAPGVAMRHTAYVRIGNREGSPHARCHCRPRYGQEHPSCPWSHRDWRGEPPPGLAEADCHRLRGHAFSFLNRVDVGVCFGWRDVPDKLEQAAVIEPVPPFQRGVINALEAAPKATAVDDFGLVVAVDRPGPPRGDDAGNADPIAAVGLSLLDPIVQRARRADPCCRGPSARLARALQGRTCSWSFS